MTVRNDVDDFSTTNETSNVESSFNPLDEEIASYLDGELTLDERRDFERRLESDRELKERFETHRSAWNALDLLVDIKPDVDVTESTVKRLNSETRSQLTELNARKRRRDRLFYATCLIASCAFGVLGYFLFGLFFPDVQNQRVNDRDVVCRLAQLEAIGDFEYLVALSQTDFFAKRPQDGLSRESKENELNRASSQGVVDVKRSYEELARDRSFYRLQQRFERLDKSSQKRWRLLWKQIETAPNSDALLKTLDDYSEWLTNFVSDEDRERLRTESVSERLADVRRKNEETARFWERFPFRPQADDSRTPSIPPDDKSNNRQNERENRPFPSDESAPSSPFATTLLTLRNLLPEELRREDFRSVSQKYELFLRNNGMDGKDSDGILDFLKTESNVYDSLSEDAKKYLASLSEDERRSALSLITALCASEKNAGDYYRRSAFRRPDDLPDRNFRAGRNFGSFGNFLSRQDVSIRELANDLKKADSNVRDYITSRPSQEAQALLFGLHWSGGRARFELPPKTSDSTPFFPNVPVPFELPPSQQAPPRRFGVSPENQSAPDNTPQRNNNGRSKNEDLP